MNKSVSMFRLEGHKVLTSHTTRWDGLSPVLVCWTARGTFPLLALYTLDFQDSDESKDNKII